MDILGSLYFPAPNPLLPSGPQFVFNSPGIKFLFTSPGQYGAWAGIYQPSPPICIYWPWPTICITVLWICIYLLICSCTGKNGVFEIVALHSWQLRIRLKHLVTNCDFNNFYSKSVALQLAAIWKRKLFAGAFQKFLEKKNQNTYLPEHFLLTAFSTLKE